MYGKEKSIIIPKHDSFGLRNAANKKIVIKHGKMTQIYEGPIVRGCYHGQGLLIWIDGNQKQIYEGHFYVNQLHGYGRMSYENGMVFEGLYRNNIRFGPGVMTHPNQCQEVGFWLGVHLLRLSCYLTTHLVPSYNASDIYTKIKLLQFKHLVDLTKPPYSIINVRDDNENYLNNNHSFPYTRHLNSLFFDTKTFESRPLESKVVSKNRFVCGHNLEDLILKNYLKISTDSTQLNNTFLLNCGISIGYQFEYLKNNSWTINSKQDENTESTIISESDKQPFKNEEFDKIQNYYAKCLAYNNNTLDKMILVHDYQQSFGEKNLLYNIDDIWNEKRTTFMPPPHCSQESVAVNLLSKFDLCAGEIQNLIQNYNVDVDIADSRGNTRLMMSSANNQHEIIKCMINLGANLECYNDDGFTPLNLTLMQYICLLNDIKKWTEYLIPHISYKFNIKKGDQNITIKNIQNMNFFEPENLSNIKLTEKYDGIENPKLRNLKSEQPLLDSVKDTIILLINMGAKSTTCSVPKTSFHLALLTTNPTILRAVFDSGGSPPYTLYNEDYKLNLLHVAVMIPTNYNVVECVKILIKHCVDPNSKALSTLNIFRYQLPWRQIMNQEATMTPLDIFCLKENKHKLDKEFMVDDQSEAKLVSILYDVTDKNHTYCGFKPIALAMLTEKLNLTETLLKKNITVVNETISGFGTLLTLLLNPNYNFNLSNENLNKLVDMLLDLNSNPFKIIEVSGNKFKGNVYEYCSMLSELKILEDISKLKKIVEKIKKAGKVILDLHYAKQAKAALIYNYKNHKMLSLPEDKKAMIFWLDSDLKVIIQQVKAGKKLSYNPFPLKNIENNKINTKKKDVEQLDEYSTVRNPINLTEEESQVCYECLKHFTKEIETCPGCYFALFCSSGCKMQHKNRECMIQIKKNSLIKPLNNLSKSDTIIKTKFESKSYLSFTRSISYKKSSLNIEKIKNSKPITVPSLAYSTSSFLRPLTSKKSKIITSDYASNYLKSSQIEDKDNTTYTTNYKKTNNFTNRLIYTNIGDKRGDKELHLSSHISNLSKKNNNNYLYKVNGKLLKNKSIKKFKKSTIYIMNSQNTNEKGCKQYCLKSKLRRRVQNQGRNLIYNHNLNGLGFLSIKYKMVRTPYWKPFFMLINRGSSNKDINLLKKLINSQMINLIIGRDGQIYHKVINNQYKMLNNYSLI